MMPNLIGYDKSIACPIGRAKMFLKDLAPVTGDRPALNRLHRIGIHRNRPSRRNRVKAGQRVSM